MSMFEPNAEVAIVWNSNLSKQHASSEWTNDSLGSTQMMTYEFLCICLAVASCIPKGAFYRENTNNLSGILPNILRRCYSRRFINWSNRAKYLEEISCFWLWVTTWRKTKFVTAKAVNRRFLSVMARFRSHFRSCGIYGGRSGTGTGLPRVLLFPL
jgi:hypothetical protein